MLPAIKIDQAPAGKPAGVPGQAREDLATGFTVTLSAVGGPYLAYRWRIVSKPIDILTPARSSALLATPNAAITTMSPIDIAGSHLIELAVDSGNGLGASSDDLVRITFYAGDTLATDPSDIPQREPAAFESTEHNAPDALDLAGNREGWARTWKKWFAVIRSLWLGKSWANGRISNPTGSPVLVRGNGIASVTPVGPGVVVVTFITPMPDALYSVLVTGIVVDASPSAACTAYATNLSENDFEVATYDLDNPGLSDGFDISFRVELAV